MQIPGFFPNKIPEEFQNKALPNGNFSQNSPSFTELLKQTGTSAINSLEGAEKLANQAAAGQKVDSQTVALGVLNASSSIRQLTGIISAATQSYKEIQHMQI